MISKQLISTMFMNEQARVSRRINILTTMHMVSGKNEKVGPLECCLFYATITKHSRLHLFNWNQTACCILSTFQVQAKDSHHHISDAQTTKVYDLLKISIFYLNNIHSAYIGTHSEERSKRLKLCKQLQIGGFESAKIKKK